MLVKIRFAIDPVLVNSPKVILFFFSPNCIVWTQRNLHVLKVILILFSESRVSALWRLVVLKFSEGQWGRIFALPSIQPHSLGEKRNKKKNPGALQNVRFPVLIVNRGRFLKAQFSRSRNAAGARGAGAVLGQSQAGLCFASSTSMERDELGSLLLPPLLTLGLLLFGFVQPQNSVLPIPSDSVLPLFGLGVGEEPAPNAFEFLVCDFQW